MGGGLDIGNKLSFLWPGRKLVVYWAVSCLQGGVPLSIDHQMAGSDHIRLTIKPHSIDHQMAGSDAIPTATIGWMFEYLPGVKELKCHPSSTVPLRLFFIALQPRVE